VSKGIPYSRIEQPKLSALVTALVTILFILVEELSLCTVWEVDGTFEKLFTQLVTIHGITQDGWIFPLVYALLPDTKASSYKVVFDELNCNEYGAVLRPDVVLLDFERATMRAIREVYPDVE
jgi:hypothetical protein